MKFIAYLLLVVCLLASLTGCRRNVPQETDGSIVPTDSVGESKPTQSTHQTEPEIPQGTAETESARILNKIWESYGEDERFAAYGGQVEMAVNDGPGDLDITATEELTTRYLIPQEQLAMVTEGASLVHLMNNNIFTAVVFRVRDGSQMKTLADAWHKAIQENRWICGQPDRLLLAQVDDNHILMSFASQDLMSSFEGKLQTAYPTTKIFYKEAIVA
jgi:hypothetical protein